MEGVCKYRCEATEGLGRGGGGEGEGRGRGGEGRHWHLLGCGKLIPEMQKQKKRIASLLTPALAGPRVIVVHEALGFVEVGRPITHRTKGLGRRRGRGEEEGGERRARTSLSSDDGVGT